MIAAYLNPSNIVFTTVHAAPFSSPVPCPPLSLLQDTCNTGLIFDFPHNFTLAPHEFIELMEELVGYCAKPTPGVEHLKRFCSCGHHTRGQIEEVHKFHDDMADDTADDDDAGGAGGLGGRAGMLAAGGLPLQPAFQSTAQWATTHAEVDEEWKRTFPPMLRRQAAFRP